MSTLQSFRRRLSTWVFLLLLAACSVDGYEESSEVRFKVAITVGSSHSRSVSLTAEDDLMKDICLFVFASDGALACEGHWVVGVEGAGAPSFSPSLQLPKGTFSVYAVANVGDLTGRFDTEQDMHSGLKCRMNLSQWQSAGLPMAGNKSIEVNGDTNVSLGMDRLVAKYSLLLDASGMNHGGRLTVQDVVLRQCPEHVYPFAGSESSARNDVRYLDGDSSSQSDIVAINAGKTLDLYVPENMQGEDRSISLSSQKVPAHLGSPEECTYLEVSCTYENEGIRSDDLKYRMYLGKNSTWSFDVVRNTSNLLTLCPQEERIHDAWWKCEGDYVDERRMEFSPPALTMFLNEDAEISLTRTPSFSYFTDVEEVLDDFLFEWQPEYDEDFQLEMDGERLRVHTGPSLVKNMESIEDFTVTASSWDNLVSASTRVIVVPVYGHWERHDVYLNYGESAVVDFCYGGSSVWESQAIAFNGQQSYGADYSIGSPRRVSEPMMLNSGKRSLTVRNTNTTSTAFVHEFIGLSFSDDDRFVKRDTLRVHINPFSMDMADPMVCFSNGQEESCTLYSKESVVMYLRDRNTGTPLDIDNYSISRGHDANLRTSMVRHDVDGLTVWAVMLECVKPCRGGVSLEVADVADHVAEAELSLKYHPVSLTLQNTESATSPSDQQWHLQLVVDNKSEIPMDISLTAVGTGYYCAVTTAANEPNVPGMRTRTELQRLSGTWIVSKHMYKDYSISDEVDTERTSDVTEKPDGTKVYEVFRDSWRTFMNTTLMDMDSFQYYRWLTYQQRAVLTTGKLKEQTLRIKIEITVDSSVADAIDMASISFFNNMDPTQSWSTLYYGYLDDLGYNLKEPWVYWNGVEFNNGDAWDDALGITGK